MKKLRVKVCCSAYYETTMEVPDNLDFNEAITYAQKNLQNIPVHELCLTDIEVCVQRRIRPVRFLPQFVYRCHYAALHSSI